MWARTLRELGKEKQTENETAGSGTPRIAVSLPSRTQNRNRAAGRKTPPPLRRDAGRARGAKTQWKHHSGPSRRWRRQNKQRYENLPLPHSWNGAVREIMIKKSALSLIYSFLFHALMTVKHAGTAFHIKPQSDTVFISHEHKSIVIPHLVARGTRVKTKCYSWPFCTGENSPPCDFACFLSTSSWWLVTSQSQKIKDWQLTKTTNDVWLNIPRYTHNVGKLWSFNISNKTRQA